MPRSREEKELIQNVMEEFEKEKNHFKRQISIQALPKDAAAQNYSNVAKRTALTLKVEMGCGKIEEQQFNSKSRIINYKRKFRAS